jgi:hypothetical protein
MPQKYLGSFVRCLRQIGDGSSVLSLERFVPGTFHQGVISWDVSSWDVSSGYVKIVAVVTVICPLVFSPFIFEKIGMFKLIQTFLNVRNYWHL